MNKIITAFVIFLLPLALSAQSKTTEALQKRYDISHPWCLYRSTLRMVNQTDDKDFDEMVRNIEKMKLLPINKVEKNFTAADYKKLVRDYKAETYEEIMSTRYEKKTFDVYLKDKKGSTLGTVIIVNDSTNLYVLDILGTIDVSKAGSLFSLMSDNGEIGQRIKSFLSDDGKHENGKKKKQIKIE